MLWALTLLFHFGVLKASVVTNNEDFVVTNQVSMDVLQAIVENQVAAKVLQITADVTKEFDQRLASKDNMIDTLVEKVELLEETVQKLTLHVNKQQMNNEKADTNEKNIATLTETVLNHKNVISDHEDTLKELKADTQKMLTLVPDFIGQKSVQDNRKRHSDEELITFFATLTNPLTHLTAGQNVPFDNVVTNIQNAYDPKLGVFVAPVSGTYVFSASLLSIVGHQSRFHFAKNGASVSRMYLGGSSNELDSSGQTVIIQLAAGDQVAIQNEQSGDGIYGHNISTFCGFMLKENFNEPIGVLGK